MNHSDFKTGTKFLCGGKRWLVTDVGSRTVIAVCLTCSSDNDYARSLPADVQDRMWNQQPQNGMPDVDPSWLNGPPYALAEHVFDENDFKACEVAP